MDKTFQAKIMHFKLKSNRKLSTSAIFKIEIYLLRIWDNQKFLLGQCESIAMAVIIIVPGILNVSGELNENSVTQVLNMLYIGSLYWTQSISLYWHALFDR